MIIYLKKISILIMDRNKNVHTNLKIERKKENKSNVKLFYPYFKFLF